MEKQVKMRKNGFFGIGVEGLKTKDNFGTLFRTAQVMGADFVFLIGRRFKQQYTDSMKSWRHLPVYQYENFADFFKHLPYKSTLIGIEIDKRAVPIKTYKHPKQACYLLGAEDHGLSELALSKCQEIIYLPGERSLNVSVAGSIVLFDRIQKENGIKTFPV